MSINLDELLAQRAEATGVEGDRVPFEFGGKTFSFLDPILMTDEQRDDMAEVTSVRAAATFHTRPDFNHLIRRVGAEYLVSARTG